MKRTIGSVISFIATKGGRRPTGNMTEPENQIARSISDPISVDMNVEKLDNIRQTGHLRPDERRQVLRVFFALHKDSRERTLGKSINARSRTVKLCGVAEDTVSRLVTNWIKASRTSLRNTTTLSLFVNQKLKTGRNTVQCTRVPANDDVFREIRDFDSTERAARL